MSGDFDGFVLFPPPSMRACLYILLVVTACGGGAAEQSSTAAVARLSPNETKPAVEAQEASADDKGSACQMVRLQTVLSQHDMNVTATTREKFKLGRMLYDQQSYANAVSVFDDVARNGDRHDLREYALNLTLDALARLPGCQQRFGELVYEYDETFCTSDGPWQESSFCAGEAGFRLVCSVDKKNAERDINAKRYKEATKKYAELARKAGCEGMAEEALFNAAVAANKAGASEQAKRLEQEFLARFAGSFLCPKLPTLAAHCP